MKKTAKIILPAFCFLLSSITTSLAFQADEDFMVAFETCKTIQIEKDRLKCFEGLKLNSKKKDKKEISKADNDKPASKTQKEKEKEFGASRLKETIAKKEKEDLKEMTSPLLEIKQSKYGRSTFFLDNGQVWQQLSHDRIKAIRAKKYTGVSLTIKRRMFGSHSLSFKGRTIRVKRIK